MSPPPADLTDLGALAGLAPELAATFASIASDIALVIDPDGVIRNVALGDVPLTRHATHWIGRAFVDTVTQDTRGKVRQLLQEVGHTGISRRREVNLPGTHGGEIPVAFAAIRLGDGGPVLAVGRDLRAIAAIQQRYVEAQQEMERDYWRQRQAESRYRLLFQVATDAVMVVAAETLQIVEANRAAAELFGRALGQLTGLPASVGIDAASRPAVDELLATARASGRPAEIRARLATHCHSVDGSLVDVSATPFRATVDGVGMMLLLVRARRSAVRGGDVGQQLSEFVEHTPDAVVITDSAGRVKMANPAFLQLCPLGSSESQIRGCTLSEALGDPARRFDDLVAEVRRQGIVRQATAPIGISFDAPSAMQVVEVSAALLDEGDQVCIGFTLRSHESRPELLLQPVDSLASAIDGLVSQLGRMSLPELMQEATYLAERHLIRNALQKSRGHLGTAAEWLGITPESLALRMQRHGLAGQGTGRSFASMLN